jgi:predicted acetyltransferase
MATNHEPLAQKSVNNAIISDTIRLVRPSLAFVASYQDALQRGWSPNNVTAERTRVEELEKIAKDPQMFVESLVDFEAKGDPIILPDGSQVERLPGYRSWMFDGEFCGSIGFRWVKGTSELPPFCLGHIGYSVVPWKQNLGYATQALALLLLQAKRLGLTHVYITTQPENVASRKVIEANRGRFLHTFIEDAGYGGKEGLKFKVDLV